MNDETKIQVTEEKVSAAPEAEKANQAPEAEKANQQLQPPALPSEWWPFQSLREHTERMIEELQRGTWRLPFSRTAFDVAPVWPGEMLWKSLPPVEIVERDDSYLITAEMPGMAPAEIEVRYAGGNLTVSGLKTEDKEEKRRHIHLSERRYGSFARSFRVPDDVDTGNIAAAFKNGVLSITLPKTKAAQQNNRTIEVEAA